MSMNKTTFVNRLPQFTKADPSKVDRAWRSFVAQREEEELENMQHHANAAASQTTTTHGHSYASPGPLGGIGATKS
jgi:hypothetical protein